MSLAGENSSNQYKESFYNFKLPIEDKLALLNLKTGSISFAKSKDETDLILKILENPNQYINNSEHNFLYKNGFIVDYYKNELKEIQDGHKQYCQSSNVVHLILLPAETCNFKCPYCFVYKHRGIIMKDWVYEAIYKFLTEQCLNGMKILQITWFGGEPLLASQKLIDFMKRLKILQDKYNISIQSSLITNGYYLTAELFEELLEAGVSNFQITFDGDKDKHDRIRNHNGQPTFDIIYNNLKNIAQSKTKKCVICIRYNFLHSNLDDVEPFLRRYIKDFLNDPRFQVNFRPVLDFETVRDDNNEIASEVCSKSAGMKIQNQLAFKVLEITRNPNFSRMFQPLPQPTVSWCPATHTKSFYIGADGMIFPCNSLIGNEMKNIGRIKPNGEIEVSDEKQEWERLFFDEREKSSKCLECKILPACLGGCRKLKIETGENACFWTEDDIFDAIKKYCEIYYSQPFNPSDL